MNRQDAPASIRGALRALANLEDALEDGDLSQRKYSVHVVHQELLKRLEIVGNKMHEHHEHNGPSKSRRNCSKTRRLPPL